MILGEPVLQRSHIVNHSTHAVLTSHNRPICNDFTQRLVISSWVGTMLLMVVMDNSKQRMDSLVLEGAHGNLSYQDMTQSNFHRHDDKKVQIKGKEMEAVQVHVAKITLDTLKTLRSALPRVKRYQQIRMILADDIRVVREEYKLLKKGKATYFTNLVALSHMMTAIAICQTHNSNDRQ